MLEFLSTNNFLPVLLGQNENPKGDPFNMLLFWGLVFGGLYFLVFAPQRKRQKEHEKTLADLKSGDRILTTGGIYGTITNVKENRLVIKIADNTKVELGKSFVHSKVSNEKTA